MAKVIRNMIVSELGAKLKDVNVCLVVNYKGITSTEAIDLRTDLRVNHVRMQVVKNNLAAIALKGVGREAIAKLFDGPSAIWHGDIDPVAMAKKAVEWRAKNPKVVVRGGYLNGRLLTEQEVVALSKLPDRKALLGMVVGTLAAPMSGFVGALNQIATKFVRVVQQVKEQKEKAGGGAPAAS